MLAVDSHPTTLPSNPPNHHDNLHEYVSAQIRQLSPDRSSRTTMGRTVNRQGSTRAVEPNQKPIRRTATEAPGRPLPNGIAIAGHDEIGATANGDDRAARPGALGRSNTDIGPRRPSLSEKPEPAQDTWELRHGYDEQYNSAEYLSQLRSVSNICSIPSCCGS